MESIYNKTKEELEEYFLSIGQKKFKAIQLYEWIYQKRIYKFSEMSNIKKEIIKKLDEGFYFETIEKEEVERSKDSNKYLFKLSDGNRVEAVLMRHDYGLSVCISSQVGCNMGCKFCESGIRKKVRDLTASEMILQILEIEKDIEEKINYIVIMGIGEPLDNFLNIKKFITIINDPKGINLGARHITISTCGIIPKIKELENFPFQVNLAISLHATNNRLRDKLMPINRVYKIEQLISAVKEYIKKTNRRVMFEYIMLDGINDKEENAKELVSLLRGINCVVNLIPYNETSHLEFKRTKKDKILKFYDIIKKGKINVTIRREFGSEISAACGQLRSSKED